MADGKQWFKVWTVILSDPGFDELHNQTIGVWTRLAAVTALHGTNGQISMTIEQLKRRCHITGALDSELNRIFSELSSINVIVDVDERYTCNVTFKNWTKYQSYSDSYERVRKHRANKKSVTKVTSTRAREKKRKEEKRKEEKKDVSLFEILWRKYPNKDGKKEALRHFEATVGDFNDEQDISKALENYLSHLRLESWKKPKNGSTWFNNWKDWVDWKQSADPEREAKTKISIKEKREAIARLKSLDELYYAKDIAKLEEELLKLQM